MRKVIACEWMSLDGVIQSPSSPGEDSSGGFQYGGWHSAYFEPKSMQWVVESVTGAGAFLFGRRTYEIFAAHWPRASAQEQVLAEPLNTRPKYVLSRSLQTPLAWNNSFLIGPNFSDEIRDLKSVSGGDLLVIGSAELVQLLLSHDLVDEFRLMIDPICLGGGKRLFPADGSRLPLSLVSSQAVSTGALLVTYSRS
jgi:dihydrofolate reductase